MKAIFALCLASLTAAPAAHSATEPWQSPAIGSTLELSILEPAAERTNAALPVIVYLKNLAAPRTGTESDEAIIQDFHAENYLVVTLDYAHQTNAHAPFLNRDLGNCVTISAPKKFSRNTKWMTRTSSSCPKAAA